MIRNSNFSSKKPILYLVATPIGNLKELSTRTLDILKEVDYIFCEDTRVSSKLVNLCGVKKRFISCHEHNEAMATKEAIRLLKEGYKVAYMSDAGMPCISDPGYILVRECLINDINVSPISGPNAALNALIASGLPTDHFYFHGFLNAKDSVKKEELRKLYKRQETLIFYEAPHRIDKTLKCMHEVLGSRKACIAREISKLHEEFIRGNLEEFLTLDKETLKGEMVIVVEGNNEEITKMPEEKEIVNLIRNFTNMGMSTKDAIKKASDLLNLPKNKVYSIYHGN
ncbi:MAG: 16S rRNA (cytidine(1402)-2'-O)-methyltransferase [Bacilli bacterium]|nr:16S rRNA (cytidine(1402)-2'-O)-methyltransferase [Bacilli bacterium]